MATTKFVAKRYPIVYLFGFFSQYKLTGLNADNRNTKWYFNVKKKIIKRQCGGVKPGPMRWAQEQRFINNAPEEKKS